MTQERKQAQDKQQQKAEQDKTQQSKQADDKEKPTADQDKTQEHKQAQESVIAELSTVLLANVDIRKLLDAISASMKQMVPHDAATLALYDETAGKLRVQFLATTGETGTSAMIDAFWAASSGEDVAAVVDVEHALKVWSGLAMLPDPDSYWAGVEINFYLYEHPKRGLLFLPYDGDLAFNEDIWPELETMDPITHEHDEWKRETQYQAILSDPKWCKQSPISADRQHRKTLRRLNRQFTNAPSVQRSPLPRKPRPSPSSRDAVQPGARPRPRSARMHQPPPRRLLWLPSPRQRPNRMRW